MKHVLFSFLTLVTMAQAQTAVLPPPAPRGIHDYDVQWTRGLFKYQYYRLSLTETDIANSPSWPKWLDSPPLDPRSAIKLAQDQLDEITKVNAWNFAFLQLQPIDQKGHWAYLVTFRRVDSPDALRWDKNAPDVVPVLMNGYVPKPKLIFISPDLLPPDLRPNASQPHWVMPLRPPPGTFHPVPSQQFQFPPDGH